MMWKWRKELLVDSGSEQYLPWKSSRRTPQYYTPFTIRTPWLLTLLVAVLACVAVLETGFRSGYRGGILDTNADEKRWIRRQANSPTSSSAGVSAVTTGTTSSEPTALISTTPGTPETVNTTSDSYVLLTTSSTIVASYATQSGYITISTASVSTSKGTGVVSAASAAATGYVTISTSSEAPVSLSAADTGYITIDTASTSRDTTNFQATMETAYVTITTTSDGQTFAINTPVSTATISTADGNLGTEGISSVPTTSWSTYEVTTTLSDGSTIIQTTSTAATSTALPDKPGVVKASQIQIGTTFTKTDYFNSSYLAIVIAVLFKTAWTMVFANFKMMEPFYQLSHPDGASAKESLLAEYLSTGYSWTHIQHIFSGHWIMLLATLVYISIGVLTSLATESSTVVSTAFCTTPDGGRANCDPVWVLNNDIARALQAILCLIAVLILLLIILNWPRKSAIFSNPSSIASMASLVSHEDTLQQLRQLDQSAEKKQLEAALSGDRYTLNHYEVAPGSGMYRYGLVRTSAPSASTPFSLSSTHNFDLESRSKYASLPNPTNMSLAADPISTSTQPFSFSHRLIRDCIFLAGLVALFGVVLAYYLDGSNSGFNRWFNSNTFGPRFILTAAAVVIDFHWKTLEREVRILVPYLRLGERMSSPEKSILVTISGTPIDNLPSALMRCEWFHALVAVTAVLSDVLIIAVAGVPYSSAQIWDAFIASAYLSLAILAWMLLAMFGILVWRRRIAKLKLPREPDTLLSVWMALADEGNTVRKEFDGWEMTKRRDRDRACRGRGGRYWGGWTKDENDQWRWSIGADGGGKVGVI